MLATFLLTAILQLTAASSLAHACNVDGTVTVQWSAVAGAQNYYLRVNNVANDDAAGWLKDPRSEYSIDALPPTTFTGPVSKNQPYEWWVHAANTVDGIGPQAKSAFTCSDAPITIPIPGRVVELAWDPNTEPILAGYSVYRQAGSLGAFAKISGVTLLKTAGYTDIDLPPGIYAYHVTASALDGTESAPSNPVQVTVSAFTLSNVTVKPDSVLPVITRVAVAGVSIPKGSSYTYTGLTQTITLAVSASDNQAIAAAQLFVDGQLLLSSAAVNKLPAVFNLSWVDNPLPAGTHALSVVVFDGAGNRAVFDFELKK